MFAAPEAVNDLLARVDGLPRKRREAQVAKFARSLSASDAAAVVAELESRGGFYEQFLAGIVAAASRNIEWITAAIAHPDPVKHRIAIGCSIRHPNRVPIPDEVFQAALENSSAFNRRLILRSLSGRPQLADKIFDQVLENWGPEVAGPLFTFCSEEFIRQRLFTLLDVVEWETLVKRHPIAVLDVFCENIWSPGFNEHCNTVVDHLPKPRTPALASRYTKLFIEYEVKLPPTVLPFKLVHKTDPDLLFRLLRLDGQSYRAVTRKQMKWLCRSKSPLLNHFLGIEPPNKKRFKIYLEALPRTKRRGAYMRAIAKGATFSAEAGPRVDTEFLDLIPREEAAKLVRPLIEKDDRQNLERLSDLYQYLPPTESKEYFLETTRRREVDDRVLGWRHFFKSVSAQNDPAQFIELLDLYVERTRNEPGPFGLKAKMGEAVLAVPIHLWTPDTLPYLNQMRPVESDHAGWFYNNLVFKLIKTHPSSPTYVNWAMDWLQSYKWDDDEVVPTYDAYEGDEDPWAVHIRSFYKRLPMDSAERFYEIVKPRVEAAMEQKHYKLLFNIVNALGPRGIRVPGLYDHLRHVAHHADRRGSAGRALTLWLKPSKTRGKRASQALDMDISFIEHGAVSQIISESRTDLLDKVLPLSSVAGRWGNKTPGLWGNKAPLGKSWVFKVHDPKDITHWTSSQISAYAAQLDRSANAPSARGEIRSITCFKDVPGTTHLVTPWLDSGRDAAVRNGLSALAGSVSELPTLLSHGADKYADTSAQAIFSILRRIPTLDVKPAVQKMLMTSKNKIVTRKEALRLAYRFLPRPMHSEILVEMMAAKKTHRDIRHLCVSLTLDSQVGPHSWKIIRAAAADPEPEVRNLILINHHKLPLLSPEDLDAYGKLVLEQVDSPYPDMVKLAVPLLRDYASVAPSLVAQPDPPVLRVLDRVITSVNGKDFTAVWEDAVRALLELFNFRPGSVHDVVKTLLELPPMSGDRDAFRYIAWILTEVSTRREKTHNIMSSLADLLSSRPEHDGNVVWLRLLSLDPEDSDSDVFYAHLESVAELCIDRPVLAYNTAVRMQNKEFRRKRNPVKWCPIAQRLAEKGTLAAGMFAWGLLRSRTAQDKNCHTLLKGLSPQRTQWLKVLHTLREHPAPDVRMLAHEIFIGGKMHEDEDDEAVENEAEYVYHDVDSED